jgi:hypothetical protein
LTFAYKTRDYLHLVIALGKVQQAGRQQPEQRGCEAVDSEAVALPDEDITEKLDVCLQQSKCNYSAD